MHAVPRFFSGRPTSHGRPLTDDEVRARAPSVFADRAHESRSDRYLYVPTSRVLTELRNEGFVPTFATQGRSRAEGKAEFTKHLIRFRHVTDIENPRPLAIGQVSPEVCLVNSHDGTSSYQLFAGLFRVICTNGIVAGETWDSVKVPHGHKWRDAVIEGTHQVIATSRRALLGAEQMAAITLDRGERQAFAEAVHALRFSDTPAQGAAVLPAQLVAPVRTEDNRPDLWTTFNVAQERAVRGGVTGVRRDDNGMRRLVTTRPVANIDGNTALNRALWTLAERMAELKGQPIAQAA